MRKSKRPPGRLAGWQPPLMRQAKTIKSKGLKMELVKGKKYDVSILSCIGWTDGDGTGHDGYDCWAYFRDGVYLGPDKHGIEPIMEPQEKD